MSEWLSRLKAGDAVIIETGWGHCSYERCEVDRVTATQVVVGNRRFRKSDGRLMGGSHYSRSELCEPIGKPLANAIRAECESALFYAYRNPSILSLEEIQQVAAIVAQAKARAEQARKEA